MEPNPAMAVVLIRWPMVVSGSSYQFHARKTMPAAAGTLAAVARITSAMPSHFAFAEEGGDADREQAHHRARRCGCPR